MVQRYDCTFGGYAHTLCIEKQSQMHTYKNVMVDLFNKTKYYGYLFRSLNGQMLLQNEYRVVMHGIEKM